MRAAEKALNEKKKKEKEELERKECKMNARRNKCLTDRDEFLAKQEQRIHRNAEGETKAAGNA